MSAGNGDRLARGARSATFGPAHGISQSKWDAMWESEEKENQIVIYQSEDGGKTFNEVKTSE